MLAELLQNKRTTIVDRWTDVTFQVYPQDSARFLRQEKDLFGNPVGHTISDGLKALFGGLLGRCPDEELEQPLDGIVRIRVVQDIPHAQALSFIFQLKAVIREVLGADVIARIPPAEVLEFESRIDRLGLQAFALYTGHIEKLSELRGKEIKRQMSVLLKREEARAGTKLKGGHEA
jgi:hypothetical protein